MEPCERPEAETEEEEEEMDPDYKFFLNHLRPNGMAYVLHIINDDHPHPHPHHPIHINYEEEEEEEEEESPLLSNNNNSYYYYTKKKKKAGEEARDDYVLGSEILEAAAETSSIDKNYGDFLHHARRMRDGSVVLELDNGAVIQYGIEEETQQQQQLEDSVSENVGRPTQLSYSSSTGNHHAQLQYSSNNKFPHHHPSHNYSSECSAEYSPFKKMLMKTLESPFNRTEYEELMKLANACKPVVKFKHLRANDIPYESDTMGLSYFGYYPELARKVKRADHFRGLNLLRGFFFWLENLELEGSYRPWASKPSHHRTVPSCSYESLT